MISKRDREGYLSIDHRNSPGISEEEAAAATASLGIHVDPVPGGTHFQSPTIRCAHCPRMVVLRPDRSRARNYCSKCDFYICDDCALLRKVSGVACRPYQKYLDQWYERAVLGKFQCEPAIFDPPK